jgi:hypothetical protein
MGEILEPTVFTRRGDTTHEDTLAQANRIAVSVWQTLVNERQQRLPVRAAPVRILYDVKTHPDKDHTDTLQAFRNTWAYDTLASNRTRFVGLIAEPVETSEDIEAVGESFRKLRENLSEALKDVLVAFTRATSETSTLVSWLQEVHHGTTSRAPSELEWTEEKNQRRCHLVDKEIEGTISVVEKAELDHLQAEMLAYRRKVAPLPLEDLRELHQELLRQASDKTTD